MKCTACGCEKLRLVKGLVYEGNYSDGNAQLNADAYVCMECGHIELYSPKLLETAKKDEAEENRINDLYEDVKRDVEQAQINLEKANKQLEALNKELQDLLVESADENITVKQHNELLKQIEEKKLEIQKVQGVIRLSQDTIKAKDYWIDNIRKKGHR